MNNKIDPAQQYIQMTDEMERLLDSMNVKPNNVRAMNAPTREEMNSRLETIETRMDGRLTSIEHKMDTKFAEIRVEMHEGFGGMIKWTVGTAIGLGIAGITVMTFVLNNAIPKSPPAQSQPIIIQAPGWSQPPSQPSK